MGVRWWVLTENKYFHFLISQISPFGIRFTNCILYKGDVEKVLKREKRSLSDLSVEELAPDSKIIDEEYALQIEACDESQVFIALHNGIPVGHVCVCSGTSYIAETEREETFDDGSYIFNLRVLPLWRRRGIARLLVMSAIEKGGKQRHAYAYVRTTNLISRRLFESLGFKPVNIVHHLRVFNLNSYQLEGPQTLNPVSATSEFMQGIDKGRPAH